MYFCASTRPHWKLESEVELAAAFGVASEVESGAALETASGTELETVSAAALETVSAAETEVASIVAPMTGIGSESESASESAAGMSVAERACFGLCLPVECRSPGQ